MEEKKEIDQQAPIEEKANIDTGYIDNVVRNVKTDEIQITEDKLRHILDKYKNRLSKSYESLALFTSLIALLATESSTDFKDKHGLAKEHWEAIFWIILFVNIIWFLISLYKLSGNISTDTLIQIIRNQKIKENLFKRIWNWLSSKIDKIIP